jgi:hypothetical protein
MYKDNESYEVEGPIKDDIFDVYALPGRNGTVVGRHRSGKVILFNKENTLSETMVPHSVAQCKVVAVSEKSIIVDPLEEGSLEPERVKEVGLELVMETNPHPSNLPWELQIIARALKHD